MSLTLAPGTCDATRSRTPARPWPQPCGHADHAAHHRVRHLHGQLDRARPRRHLRAAAVHQPARRRVLGVNHQRAARRPLHQPLAVVQPRVVAAQVPPPDQHEPRSRARRRRSPSPLEPRQIREHRRRRQLHLAILRLEPLRQPRLERAQIQPVLRLPQLAERQPVRPRAQRQIHDALRSQLPGACASRSRASGPSRRGAPIRRHSARQISQSWRASAARSNSGGEYFADVAHRERVERHVVVRALERRASAAG